MNRHLGIITVFLCVASKCYSQAPVLKYNVNESMLRVQSPEDLALAKAKINAVSTIDSAGNKVKVNKRNLKYGFYLDISNSFGKVANTLFSDAETKYQNGLKGLKIPTDGTLDIYNTTMQGFRTKHESDIAVAYKYINEQKTFYYYYKTTGRLNYCFQDSGFVNDANDAQMFYNELIADKKSKLLNNTLISFGSDGSTASIYNELYSDYLGPIRLGIGVLLNNQSSTSGSPADSTKIQNDAIQRLLGGGANAVASISYPLVSYQGPQKQFNIKVFASPKVGADIPKIGTSTSSYAYNYDLGGEAGMYYSGATNVITVYTHLRSGYVGGSNEFYTGLNKTDKKPFFLNQFSLGIAVTSVFTISWNTYFGDPFVNKHFSNTLSVAISPN